MDPVAVAFDLARELGYEGPPAEVLAERSNLVLALDAIVARVALATSTVRVGMESLRREVEVARFLGDRVTRPSVRLPPGPFEREGFVISFWERERLVAERADPREAGTALRAIHAALERYPGVLPEWGAFEETRAVKARARLLPVDRDRLERAWDRAERVVEGARARTASFQAVHGDAHIGNVLATDRGALWTDWEDAFLGPIEYDLACLRSKADLFGEERATIDAMTEAYLRAGPPPNPELVVDLGFVRNVIVIPWLAVFAERDPDLVPRMRRRLAKLDP